MSFHYFEVKFLESKKKNFRSRFIGNKNSFFDFSLRNGEKFKVSGNFWQKLVEGQVYNLKAKKIFSISFFKYF